LWLYREINLVVNEEDFEKFKTLRIKDLLGYRHLKIICTTDNSAGISLKSHPLWILNNFTSITWVIREGELLQNENLIVPENELPENDDLIILPSGIIALVGASRLGIQKFIVKIPQQSYLNRHDFGDRRSRIFSALEPEFLERQGSYELSVETIRTSGKEDMLLEYENLDGAYTKRANRKLVR
jgi:hypothetical protein